MPKITRSSGPTYADPVTGEPVRGPERLQVIPDAEPAEEPATEPEIEAEQFDPSLRTVADVQAYLASCDDQAERERVLDAEAAGKNRTTIMTGRAAGMLTDPGDDSE